jgi:hypothetical protein
MAYFFGGAVYLAIVGPEEGARLGMTDRSLWFVAPAFLRGILRRLARVPAAAGQAATHRSLAAGRPGADWVRRVLKKPGCGV